MREVIFEEHEDNDGVGCYIDRGDLIRCKDCKYYVKKYGVCNAYITFNPNKKDDDFCSLAERREK